MRWINPSARLDSDQVYALLAIRGLDDWLQPGDFFDLARYLGPTSEGAYRHSAIELARRLIQEGHAQPGDVIAGAHHPWGGSADERLARVEELWLDPEVDARFAFVWFDLTKSGHTFAEDAAKHEVESD